MNEQFLSKVEQVLEEYGVQTNDDIVDSRYELARKIIAVFYTQDEIAQMMTNNLYIDEDVKGRQAIVGIGTVAKWIAEGK